MALLATLGIDVGEMADVSLEAEEPEDFEQSMLDWLAHDVGDRTRLDRLDEDPLPDEPFRWDGIPDDVTARVREVLGFVDGCCEEMLDLEYRTAHADGYLPASHSGSLRFFVARVVVRKPLLQRWFG